MRMTLTALALVTVSTLALGQDTFSPEHLARAKALHRRVIVLDTHSDVTPMLEKRDFNFAERHQEGHMDIPRMRDGGINAQFFSIWMGDTPGDGRAIKTALRRIDAVHEAIRKHPSHLELASSADDIERIAKSGRIACLMGIEGGHIIEDDLAALRSFYQLGCRYMTLTHSFNTPWADAAGVDESTAPVVGGLNARGEEIVLEMNRLGMMVDISHVAKTTFQRALEVSRAPVIASHSSCRALQDHRRNLDDDQLRALKKNGGVLMINFYSEFIDKGHAERRLAWEKEHQSVLGKLAGKFKANRQAYEDAVAEHERLHPMPRTPLAILADHVGHAAKIMGWEHVGMGADWDGVPALPERMQHCGELHNLTALLLARGASESNLTLFLGKNLLRVLRACEQR